MKAENISTIAVIGAGTMGSNIAAEFARLGCEVRLMDIDRRGLNQGRKLLENGQAALVEAGVLKKREAQAALKRMAFTTDLAMACKGVDLLVEAVAEKLSLKKTMFKKFQALCPKRAILASNTSGLSISRIASAVDRPGRVAGVHFWNPPHIIPLVEVTKGKKTTPATARCLMDLCRRLGKRPILVKHDIPGFVGNRLQFAVFREALHLVAEGIASAEDIDTAMTAGPGLRYGLLGPLRTADLGGLDIFSSISDYLFAELSAAKKSPKFLKDMIANQKRGAKTGQGFYSYQKSDLKKTLVQRDKVLLSFLKVLEKHGAV